MLRGENNGGLTGPHHRDDDPNAWLFVVVGFAVTLALAFTLGVLLEAPATTHIHFSIKGFVIGVAAAVPLIVLLHLLMQANQAALKRFRDSQIELFAQIGFTFTLPRIVLMALAAGVSEELLFRGVLQVWSSGFLPVWLAIFATNAIFGALHARTLGYALIAFAVGVYFGALFELTGDLLTPITAHALYDAVALEYTRRAVDVRKQADR